MSGPVIVQRQTGEIEEPADYLARLRDLEEEITRQDAIVAALSRELKTAKEAREEAVLALRGAVRDERTLPLFDAPE